MTGIEGFRHLASGKVRDLWVSEDDDDVLLLVASDRVSAFDVVLEPEVPGKGALLTRLTRWWLDRFPDLPNHLLPDESRVPPPLRDRAMLVRRLRMHPVECVVRGYLTGSGLAEYRATGSVSGVALPPGLDDGDRLPEPIFTPAYKAPAGEHDENIDLARTAELVGARTADALREASLTVYARAQQIAADRGLLLADTKLEFGDDPDTGALVLADEVLTPDSSRYWDADAYAAGRRGASFDKQGVRDWVRAHWDGTGAPAALPPDLVRATSERYRELVERFTGRNP